MQKGTSASFPSDTLWVLNHYNVYCDNTEYRMYIMRELMSIYCYQNVRLLLMLDCLPLAYILYILFYIRKLYTFVSLVIGYIFMGNIFIYKKRIIWGSLTLWTRFVHCNGRSSMSALGDKAWAKARAKWYYLNCSPLFDWLPLYENSLEFLGISVVTPNRI